MFGWFTSRCPFLFKMWRFQAPCGWYTSYKAPAQHCRSYICTLGHMKKSLYQLQKSWLYGGPRQERHQNFTKTSHQIRWRSLQVQMNCRIHTKLFVVITQLESIKQVAQTNTNHSSRPRPESSINYCQQTDTFLALRDCTGYAIISSNKLSTNFLHLTTNAYQTYLSLWGVHKMGNYHSQLSIKFGVRPVYLTAMVRWVTGKRVTRGGCRALWHMGTSCRHSATRTGGFWPGIFMFHIMFHGKSRGRGDNSPRRDRQKLSAPWRRIWWYHVLLREADAALTVGSNGCCGVTTRFSVWQGGSTLAVSTVLMVFTSTGVAFVILALSCVLSPTLMTNKALFKSTF